MTPKAELATYMSPTLDSAVVLSIGHGGNMAIWSPAKRISYSLRSVPGTSVYREPSLASLRIGIIDDARRFEARALASKADGSLDATWTCIVGVKPDGSPDLVTPALSAWVQSDTLREPRDISVGGGFTQDQINAEVKAATDPLLARIAGIKAKVAAGAIDVADD